jgi:glucosamine 6-phosphate synthetase-like amidotransferase/phosphosugar isomerase protein
VNGSFLREIRMQPETLRGSLADLREQAAMMPALDMRRLILTGSGDSFIAAAAVAPLFEERLDIPVKALPSLDASGFHRWASGDVLVAASVSGEVTRTIDAVERAVARHVPTVGITAQRESTLVGVSDVSLITPPSIDRSTPHARDYTVALLAFGTLLEGLTGHRAPELDAWPDVAGSVIDAAFDVLRDEPAVDGTTWFLGAGPDRATAAYGALKFWEAAGLQARWDDLEEFAHGSLLMARPADRVVVVASGRGAERAAEMLPGFLSIGVRPLTVGPERIADDCPHVDAVALDGSSWQPFTSCLPLQLLTYVEACSKRLNVSVLLDGQPHAAGIERVHAEWVRQPLSRRGARPEVVA